MSGCPFRLAVINDEITQDFEKACSIAAKDFGLSWIELRGMWNKNITELDQKEVAEARKILEEHRLRVTDIASPLFKVDWPGAPRSKQSEKRDQFHADFDMSAQDKLLERCIQLAKAFQTDRIRCFDFWRLEDQKPYRAAMDQKLREAAARCEKDGMILLLENEMSCNTATGAESKRTLAAVTNKNFMLNWDPGNAAAIGEYPYSKGFDLLPKARIGHCHAKDVVEKPGGRNAGGINADQHGRIEESAGGCRRAVLTADWPSGAYAPLAVLAARAHAPAARRVGFASFGRLRLELWLTEADMLRMTGK
jgi:sugar phosphate isomerase/epimerase